MHSRLGHILLILVALGGCTSPEPIRFHAAGQYPEKLSAWGIVALADGMPRPHADSMVYALNTALFTDYAQKLRTVYLPDGTHAVYHPEDAFELPVGSIISKTFFYLTDAQGRAVLTASWDENPDTLTGTTVRPIETRLLVRQPDGWDALPYVWRGDDAYLSITGDLFTLELQHGEPLNYVVPSRNQCAGCHASNHTTGEVLPLGFKARHLNRTHPVSEDNQLALLSDRGWLQGLPEQQAVPANARWGEADADLAHQARSYLDINCGHCHNPAGAADTSGLLLDYAAHPAAALGVCKPPIAAGRGSGGHLYSIVPGDAAHSIVAFRMSTTDPGTMMPELGRSLVHEEGVALITAWIDALPGQCR